MTRRTRGKALLAILVLAACIVFSQQRILHVRSQTHLDEVQYLPTEKLLDHFTAGMSSVIADLVWLQAVQYTGRHFRGDKDFAWLKHMCETVTRLDPHFVDAYRYGGLLLASLNADKDSGIELLRRGMIDNPFAWELPYEIGMTYLLHRRDYPGFEVEAARYLAMAVETGKAPGHVTRLAASLQADHDLLAIERRMWEATLDSEDKFLRELAMQKLQLVALREATRDLNEAVAAFEKDTGRKPRSIRELAEAGLIPGIPEDPLGGEFQLWADGVIRNTTILVEEMEKARSAIRNNIEAFEKRYERLPKNLDEIVGPGFLPEIPGHPVPGQAWQYDNRTGEIESVSKAPTAA